MTKVSESQFISTQLSKSEHSHKHSLFFLYFIVGKKNIDTEGKHSVCIQFNGNQVNEYLCAQLKKEHHQCLQSLLHPPPSPRRKCEATFHVNHSPFLYNSFTTHACILKSLFSFINFEVYKSILYVFFCHFFLLLTFYF